MAGKDSRDKLAALRAAVKEPWAQLLLHLHTHQITLISLGADSRPGPVAKQQSYTSAFRTAPSPSHGHVCAQKI